jgi:serine/threonine protein kinase/WD40 repeat protein
MDERTIFLEALERSDPAERSAYLDAACGADPTFRKRIEALLESHEIAGDFLGPSVPQRLAEELTAQQVTAAEGDESSGGDAKCDDLAFLNPPDEPGSLGRLGHYDIQAVVGRGGMGIVLRAFDRKLHRIVAIKVMAPSLATSPTARKRFVREAQAAAAVSHDHVITVHAVEEALGLPYLVMQYVDGVSLEERLKRGGPPELQEILRIGMQTASGLAAAHAQGLIHRDVKPANILLENGVERVKITDFGLARAAADASLTHFGAVAGTPQYMAPEQAHGDAVDHRADLFSFGSVLYAMCTGQPPFCASGTMAVLKLLCEETPASIRETNPEIPDWLVTIVEKLHAKDPQDRYQSADEVADLLSRYLAYVQHPSSALFPEGREIATPNAAHIPPFRSRAAQRWALAAAVLVLVFGGLSVTEATGVTNLGGMVIRIFTPEGTLVVETDDPAVKVTIEGDGGLVITGAGPQEVRLKAGSYRLQATKNGKSIKNELVTITRGHKQVIKVSLEGAHPHQALAAGEIRRFEGHTGPVWSVAFTPDGRRALSASADSSVRVWDIETGKELRRFEGHNSCVYSVAVSPDGSRVLSGDGEHRYLEQHGSRVCLWALDSGKQLQRFDGTDGAVTNLAFSADGRQALIGQFHGTVLLWDLETWQEIKRFGHPLGVWSACFSPDGRQAVTAGGDDKNRGYARVWDLESGKELQRYEGHTAGIWQAVFTPDGRRIVSASGDQTMRLWDAQTGREVRRFRHNDDVTSVSVPADGRRALSGSYGTGNTLFLWDLETGQTLKAFEGHTNGVQTVAISPDGRRALSGSHDHTVRLWDLILSEQKDPDQQK